MVPTAEPKKKKSPPQPKVQLNVAVPPALKARVAFAATRRDCFESSIVREALEAYLADLEGQRR